MSEDARRKEIEHAWRMDARSYIMGRPQSVPVNRHAAGANVVLEVELADGRTVQLCVNHTGDIHVRGWGNVPQSVGNMNQVEFSCKLVWEEQTTCRMCGYNLGDCSHGVHER